MSENKAIQAECTPRSQLSSASGLASSTPRRSEETLQTETNAPTEVEDDSEAAVEQHRIQRKDIDIIQHAEPNSNEHNATKAVNPSPLIHAEGILRHTSVPLIRDGTTITASRQIVINGIPLAGVMLLDLANSADFPANVFNEIPVPTYAQVLMAISATFSLMISIFASVDACRSWRSIKLLRKERTALLARQAEFRASSADEKAGQTPDYNTDIETFIHLNRRDLGCEFFERFGLECFMGLSALIVSCGTYLAIDGDDPTAFGVSFLLSGYVGNFFATFYGVINAVWSIILYNRGRRQYAAAGNVRGSKHAQRALRRRALLLKTHSAVGGVSCLVSGALGMVTPTQWEPYPVLAVLGFGFAYTMYLFRTRIGYIRAPIGESIANVSTAKIAAEIDLLFETRLRLADEHRRWRHPNKELKRTTEATAATSPAQRLQEHLQDMVLSGSFDTFASFLFAPKDAKAGRNLNLADFRALVKERGLTILTPEDVLDIVAHLDENSSSAGDIYDVLEEIWVHDVRKIVLESLSMRTRFLTELLGSHLIICPMDSCGRQRRDSRLEQLYLVTGS